MKLLDLFCGEGGAAAGYVAAGFEVHGVDSDPARRARYLASGAATFTVADAAEFPFDGFDVVHASPPCQDHSTCRTFPGVREHGTGWLLGHVLARLRDWGGLWVVENVPGAARDMPGSLVLCGSEFGLGAQGRVLRRHRLFLSNVWLMGAGGCCCRGRPSGGVYGHGPQHQRPGDTGGYGFHAGPAREAMGMPWASRQGLSQAIPPAYTRFIGEQLAAALAPAARGVIHTTG